MISFFKKRWVIGILCLIGGFVVGIVAASSPKVSQTASDQREMQSPYQFISPLLACGSDNYGQLGNDVVNKLTADLNAFVSHEKESGTLVDASIIFRELNGGPYISINADAVFTPGSLLKVPLAMSVYLKSEKQPGFLDQKIIFDGGSVPAQEHFTAPTIEIGKTYSVEDLVRATLINSDNNAAQLLTQLISKDELNDAYSHLGIQIPESGQDYSMSAKTYASFFRILYNATFLNHDDSEHLLSVLSQVVFHDGLIAGLPQGMVASHKFGERMLGAGSGVQLHDCGIVYLPEQPYQLCVMMRGSDLDKLAHAIADISKIVYGYEK